MKIHGSRSQHIRLLNDSLVQDIQHFGRPLKQHLIGTYDLLVQWGNPEEVCLAGLFHSIYGTKTFRTAAMTIDSRKQLQRVIGDRAEYLVFVFGMSDRKHLLLANQSAPYHWIDYRNSKANRLTGSCLSHLVEIEVANFIEQIPSLANSENDPNTAIQEMRSRFDSAVSLMSIGARQAYIGALVEVQNSSVDSQRPNQSPEN